MGIIVLIIFGFLLVAFAFIFSPRHSHSVNKMLEQNHGVMPLFKERSAGIKYRTLHDALKNTPTALQALEKLHHDFKEKLIDLEVYYNALEEMSAQYLKH